MFNEIFLLLLLPEKYSAINSISFFFVNGFDGERYDTTTLYEDQQEAT